MSTMLKTAPLAPREGLALPGDWRAVIGRAALAPFHLLIVWQRRIQDREALQTMTDYQLKDIGIDSVEALREAEKPFWRA
jgi:uncharacterized protein YjiS (DUF1127 family)